MTSIVQENERNQFCHSWTCLTTSVRSVNRQVTVEQSVRSCSTWNSALHHLLLESTSATMLNMHQRENAANIVAKWASMTPAGWSDC